MPDLIEEIIHGLTPRPFATDFKRELNALGLYKRKIISRSYLQVGFARKIITDTKSIVTNQVLKYNSCMILHSLKSIILK